MNREQAMTDSKSPLSLEQIDFLRSEISSGASRLTREESLKLCDMARETALRAAGDAINPVTHGICPDCGGEYGHKPHCQRSSKSKLKRLDAQPKAAPQDEMVTRNPAPHAAVPNVASPSKILTVSAAPDAAGGMPEIIKRVSEMFGADDPLSVDIRRVCAHAERLAGERDEAWAIAHSRSAEIERLINESGEAERREREGVWVPREPTYAMAAAADKARTAAMQNLDISDYAIFGLIYKAMLDATPKEGA